MSGLGWGGAMGGPHCTDVRIYYCKVLKCPSLIWNYFHNFCCVLTLMPYLKCHPIPTSSMDDMMMMMIIMMMEDIGDRGGGRGRFVSHI